MDFDNSSRLFEEALTEEAVIAIIANDLPAMTEAQLAELLTNFFIEGPSVVRDAIAPLARAELTRRRFVDYVESIVAAA